MKKRIAVLFALIISTLLLFMFSNDSILYTNDETENTLIFLKYGTIDTSFRTTLDVPAPLDVPVRLFLVQFTPTGYPGPTPTSPPYP